MNIKKSNHQYLFTNKKLKFERRRIVIYGLSLFEYCYFRKRSHGILERQELLGPNFDVPRAAYVCRLEMNSSEKNHLNNEKLKKKFPFLNIFGIFHAEGIFF